ncbi:integral membrane protein [Fusarium phyllophilum]|uniref:Integral membrane protein n=1 Tax=Fusarium phyllophilum TaxID=47803 RepID=A0A8H5K7F4_9HYPO|nr:integral membrane protein [Fusarium phyllophilum]
MASVQPPNPLPPDQNVGPILLGISGTCLALVIITTSVRIWVRTALRSSGWDDYTIAIVTLLGIARFGVQVGQTCQCVLDWCWGVLESEDSNLLHLRYDWATGFGIARATSLGVVTSDLSWVYAITAIWSNLELYLGIVGANLALSRSIFAYFFREGVTTKGSSYGGMPRSTSASRNLRVPSSSGGFRSGQSRLQSIDQDSEISLVQTTKKQPTNGSLLVDDIQIAGPGDVDAAVDATEKAFPAWKKASPEVTKGDDTKAREPDRGKC